MFVDEIDNPVKRTKWEYPYGYDGFVQERVHPNEKANGSVYTDRLLQWDYDKTRRMLKKHFKDTGIDIGGDYWDKRTAKQIEGVLREWLDAPLLEVVLVMNYCNVSNGYPTWRIDYYNPPKPKDFQGVELSVGDWVAATVSRYRNLVRGKVVAFTPKMVRVQTTKGGNQGWNMDTFLAKTTDVIRLTKQDYELPSV